MINSTFKRRLTLGAAAIALSCGAPVALAAPAGMPAQDTIDSDVTQLPRTAVPRHYRVEVVPDAAHLRFKGKVAIDLDVVKPTDRLTLNAADLAIDSASLQAAGGPAMPAKVTLDPASETATFVLAHAVAPGRYRLAIAYTGKINVQANGFFALDYRNQAGAPARSLFTQFEPADARRFVPSWDEPDYKATWDLSAIVPVDQMAVSNLPAASSQDLGNGTKRVTFGTTPLMSSYLLFFATGDFGRITDHQGATETGIVVSRGNEAKAQTALHAETQVLGYYNSYFGTPFPLPKLDNVAGPGQSAFFGAMENWGAIFTFERILLDDPAITTENERQEIFGVEAHEMAHQWFGDLVTMAWWNDIWLNEGFASWMASKTTDHFHPDWGALIDRVGAREAAMNLDAYATTHPIVQDIRTVGQMNQAFDTITYQKGESVIAMLEGFAGPDVWQRGIQHYIAAHKYRNTKTDDLWAAVEGAGAPGLTRIAHEFTLQPGVPMLRVGAPVCDAGHMMVPVEQAEFTRDRHDQQLTAHRWNVPVRAEILGGGAVTTAVTSGPSTMLHLPGCGPVMLNVGQTGYYRTLYRPEQLAALTKALPRLDAVDQYGLLADQTALAMAGYQPMGPALDMVAAVPADANRKVTGLTLGTWAGLWDMYRDAPAQQAAIGRLIQHRYTPILAALGDAPRAGESALDATLRPQLLATLGMVGDPAVVARARANFDALEKDPNAVPGSLKSTWLGIVARNADSATWDRLHALAKAATGTVERSTYYSLLGLARDNALAQRTLDLALSGEAGTTISSGMFYAVAQDHADMTLDFVLAHLDRVHQLVDNSGWLRFVAQVARGSDQASAIDKLNAYANAHLPPADRHSVMVTVAAIRQRLVDRPRIKAQTNIWLAAHQD